MIKEANEICKLMKKNISFHVVMIKKRVDECGRNLTFVN